MFDSLRKRMTLLYTVSTGLILTLVLLGVLLVSEKELERNERLAFNSSLLNLTANLQTAGNINGSWLASLESDGRLLIHIEDNGNPLLFQGSWTPKTPREQLVKKAKEAALSMGVNTRIRPISSLVTRTDIFSLSGDQGDTYLASVLVMAVSKGYQSIVLLKELPKGGFAYMPQRIRFLLLDLAGILALFFISWIFVGRSLKPLEENRRKQHEFIAAASHELRSPLAVIRSSAAAVRVSPDRQDQLLTSIDRECERMNHLISDLLVLASSDSKNWHLQMEAVDLDTLLIEAYETFEPLCQAHGQKLHLELPEESLPKMQGDRIRLEQILTILLDNAVNYTPSGKEIFVRALVKRGRFLLQVEDEGVGIPDKEKQAVFDRFYRSDTSRNDKKHFGLGLSVAKELTELHGGRIHVTDGAHKGACFVVEFPIRRGSSYNP